MEQEIDNKPWLWSPPRGKDGYIGRRGLRPKEAMDKVTGEAVFTNDIYIPGMLYAKAFRSPYAHARIKKMDSSKAEDLPGVWIVIRYDDPDIDLSDPYKGTLRGNLWNWWRESILPDVADFFGARVGALVVAENEEICDQALRLIGEGIEWEQMPFILDPEESTKPGAPLLHPEINNKSNIWKDVIILNMGDVEKGFASSDQVIEFSEYKKDDDVMAGVEPGCMVAHFKGDELEFWYHGKVTGMDKPNMVAPVFKNDPNYKAPKLRLHVPYSGGTYGGNAMGFTAHLVRYAVIAAKKTGRPVKVVDDYSMSWEAVSFETGTAHYKIGFNNDGTIVAIKITVYQKTGHPITVKFIDTIKTPNVYVHEILTYWSKPHETCWKDGAANCTLANLIINKVAAHLGMDPIKVQLINDGCAGHDMAWLDENIKKKYGMPIRDSLKEIVEAGKKAFDWDNKWHAPGTRKLPNGKMHGVGFYAVSCWATGRYAANYPAIYLAGDGKATIYFRRCDEGQSVPTTYCQIVADETGIRYEDVNIELDDSICFDSMGPGGSFGANINSLGLILNARSMKRLILERALKPLASPPGFMKMPSKPIPSPFEGKNIDDLDMKDSNIFEKANPSNTLPLKKLTSLLNASSISAETGPFFVANMPAELPNVKDGFHLARQGVFVEVEVDTETGQVEVTKLAHPYDVGRSINPDVNDQQLYGGAYQGVGVSATEAIYYDPKTGVKLNDNLVGYPVLTILDVGDIDCPIIETHLGFSPYGLFGCSEAGKAATAAAILVPAVYNAIGKWIEDTPVTPDRVLKTLGKA